jgi:nitrite reductase/ring-hydroxylating ferredoxin subunit
MIETTLGARPVVVARTHAGRLYAFSGRCLHHGAPLVHGRLLIGVDGDSTGEYRVSEGRDILKCPWHGYEYDLRSGAVLFDNRRRLRVFTARERDGRVLIETREAACPA